MLDAALVILAGGRGTRMGGKNKALLEFSGQTMIERLLAEVGRLFPQRLLIGPALEGYVSLGLEVFPDIFPGCGPLGGIHAGLAASRHHQNLFSACDLPFINPTLARYLVEQAGGFDVTVPRINGLLEPLFAVYSKGCLKPAASALRSGKRRIIDFYPEVRVQYIDEATIRRFGDPDHIFLNVNSPLDLKRAEESADWVY